VYNDNGFERYGYYIKQLLLANLYVRKINSNNEVCNNEGALEEYIKNIRKRDGKGIIIVKEKHLRCQMRGC